MNPEPRLVLGDGLVAEFSTMVDWSKTIDVCVAWASSSNPCHNELLAASKKVRRLVVGLHFHQTHPKFIDDWRKKPETPLRLVNDLKGIFHPKVYLFRKGREARLLMGSANFTGPGFGGWGGRDGNTECMVLLETTEDSKVVKQALDLVDHDWTFVTPTDSWLSMYTSAYRRRAALRRRLSSPGSSASSSTGSSSASDFYDLAIDFQSYFDIVINAGRDRAILRGSSMDYTLWLGALDHVHGLDGWPELQDMDLEGRKRVFGIREYPDGDHSVNLRAFGWARYAALERLFSSRQATRCLQYIPSEGVVSRSSWKKFVTAYKQALRPTALTTASRLLMLKRPDLFASVNKRSIDGIRRTTGISIKDLDDYWEAHLVIWSWPWSRSKKPKSTKRLRVWQARVALLDVLHV